MHKILLTGATGYIGGRLLEQMLKDREENFLIPIRATTDEEFEKKRSQVLKSLSADSQKRIEIIRSELNQLSETLAPYQDQLTMIIHNAAQTAFNISEEVANTVNRDASLSLLKFARSCKELKAFIYVSTLYASGMAAGPIQENFFQAPQFANHYERSKWEVERAIETEFQDLPWRIARVATLVSDDETGKVVQQNAIHNTLKLFYYGLISLLPGKATTPIHLVDGEFVTRSLAAIVNKGSAHKIYHVCYDQSGSIPLGRLIDVAFEEFSKDEMFKARRLLKPLFTDEKSFETLVTNMKGFGGTVLNQGLSSISPFGRQLFIAKEVQNGSMQALLQDYRTPPIEETVRKTCQYLAQTKFSKTQKEGSI